MRLVRRLTKLEAARTPCDGRVSRVAGPDEPHDDHCPRCGGCHVLVVEEVVVEVPDPTPTGPGGSRCA